jgi:lipid II:glycine glycyltransferase (peptidoglycan interpeptide bridge formation enzyme)
MYEELVYKLRHCNLYGEEPLHWVRIICDAAEAIEKLQSELEHLKNCRHECKIDCLLKEYNKKCNELEQVKAERETFLKEKAEREKGCEFCNAEYAVMSGSRMSSELIHKGCVAKFCPNCGKRLVSEE